MKLEAKIVTGPSSSKVSKEAAEAQLRSHPAFPKDASVTLEEVEGRWVAAIATVKEAELPFEPPKDEGPSEDGPPAPPSEDEGPPSEDGPPSDDEGGEEKPEGDGEHKEKGEGKKGEGAELSHLVHLVTTLLTALGINPEGPGDSHIPGLDEGPPGGPEGQIPGGPPAGPPGPGGPDAIGDGKNHTVHERSLKPGEAPPGSTPIGSPAFAATKIADDHPWADAIGVKRSFPVEEVIEEDTPMSSIKAELDSIADGTGYSVKQLVEGRNKAGQRTAKALIAR